MEAETFPDATVQQAMKGFTCVFVDADKHPDLKKKYVQSGIPSTSILDKTGKVVRTFEGGMKPKEFLSELKRGQDLVDGKAPPPPTEADSPEGE